MNWGSRPARELPGRLQDPGCRGPFTLPAFSPSPDVLLQHYVHITCPAPSHRVIKPVLALQGLGVSLGAIRLWARPPALRSPLSTGLHGQLPIYLPVCDSVGDGKHGNPWGREDGESANRGKGGLHEGHKITKCFNHKSPLGQLPDAPSRIKTKFRAMASKPAQGSPAPPSALCFTPQLLQCSARPCPLHSAHAVPSPEAHPPLSATPTPAPFVC